MFECLFTDDEHKHLAALSINNKINESTSCCMEPNEHAFAMRRMVDARVSKEDYLMIAESLVKNMAKPPAAAVQPVAAVEPVPASPELLEVLAIIAKAYMQQECSKPARERDLSPILKLLR